MKPLSASTVELLRGTQLSYRVAWIFIKSYSSEKSTSVPETLAFVLVAPKSGLAARTDGSVSIQK